MPTLEAPAALVDRARAALKASPYQLRKQMDVEDRDGRLVLRGEVQSYFQKQMAQETLRRVDGVELIDNLLEVNWR